MKNLAHPDINELCDLSKKGNVVPVFKEILADLETPVSAFLKLSDKRANCYLLESVEGGEHWGRYSFISWEPKLIFKSQGNKVSIGVPGAESPWKTVADPLSELRDLMSGFKPVEVKGLPRFWGGAVGYAAYDSVRFFEDLPAKPEEELGLPDSVFLITDRIVIFDHLSHSAKIVICVHTDKNNDLKKLYSKVEKEIDSIIAEIKSPLRLKRSTATGHSILESNVTKKQFCDKINKAKEYIMAGDIIQVVLSQRFSRKTKASGMDIYRSLRLINPSPYMYYLKFDGFEIAGSSPEILVRKEDDLAETRPIAGTRPRSSDAEIEARLEKELLADEKERAEHIMLVDLGRNDLGRVCEPASVKVPELMTIERFSHVMHIVSSVIGKLKKGIDSFALFRACFPAGTVSGAPKVRAMQIIDELEPTARGPYAGAIGYFSYSGNMDMAITIRTIVKARGVAYAQAGAGIVADSVPESEYQETKNKAAALFAAIDKAEEGID